MSLGGLHDESELRGHRRTYIGAMPGRIIQAIRRAGVNNPVLMLDEIDKLGRDFRGDPTAALLEVLDPAQNSTFRDNYLDMPFDLSKVFFIATANTLDVIPPALLDRMEVLRLSGYSEEEKLKIATRYLIPRQLVGGRADADSAHDQRRRRCGGSSPATRARPACATSSGCSPGSPARWPARWPRARRNRSSSSRKTWPRCWDRNGSSSSRRGTILEPGVATGLAWTEAGGDVLYVEASLLPGARGLRLTGQLGDVMRESARAAQTYIWSHAEKLGINPKRFRHSGLHIHVPAGAVPKDGPSAGVTMATALASLYTGLPVRSHTAMTGEITLTGLVLPVGGIKEKMLAAHRAGIRRVIIPRANEKDLRELPESVRQAMEFTLADRIEQVLRAAIPELAGRLSEITAA